jgi:hypothetical protein
LEREPRWVGGSRGGSVRVALVLDSVVKERGWVHGPPPGMAATKAGSRGAVCPPIDYRFWWGRNEPKCVEFGRNGEVNVLQSTGCDGRENSRSL